MSAGSLCLGGVVYLRKIGVGHLFFAVGFAAIGAISLEARDFLLHQQPVPPGIPWRETLACISAALMLVPGVGLLLPATARRSAFILTAFVALWVVALQLPRALAHPLVEGKLAGCGRGLAPWSAAAGSSIARSRGGGWQRSDRTHSLRPRAGADRAVTLLLSDGRRHPVPAWMPLRVPLTALGGAGHIAAGLAIAFGVVPRLAATLEAIMESLFTVICWVSAVVATPPPRGLGESLHLDRAQRGGVGGRGVLRQASASDLESRGLEIDGVRARHDLERTGLHHVPHVLVPDGEVIPAELETHLRRGARRQRHPLESRAAPWSAPSRR